MPNQRPKETDAERAYRLLAEDMKAEGLIGDYEMSPADDDNEEWWPDYDYLDDDDDDDDDYDAWDDDDAGEFNAGWSAGYERALEDGRPSRIIRRWLARLKWKLHDLRRALLRRRQDDSDIPF